MEDERAIAEGLTVSLEAEGFQVTWVKDGSEAVPAYERVRPDLVLLDLMLPGRNGLQICADIRTQSTVPIVMLTAKGDTIDVVQGRPGVLLAELVDQVVEVGQIHRLARHVAAAG